MDRARLSSLGKPPLPWHRRTAMLATAILIVLCNRLAPIVYMAFCVGLLLRLALLIGFGLWFGLPFVGRRLDRAPVPWSSHGSIGCQLAPVSIAAVLRSVARRRGQVSRCSFRHPDAGVERALRPRAPITGLFVTERLWAATRFRVGDAQRPLSRLRPLNRKR
jgi:hypothetical protein